MGAICCEPGGYTEPERLRDLPQPSVAQLTDKYSVWEYKTPFKRTIFLAFKLAVLEAEAKCGRKGYVTLEALSDKLTTKVWQGLGNSESLLS